MSSQEGNFVRYNNALLATNIYCTNPKDKLKTVNHPKIGKD